MGGFQKGGFQVVERAAFSSRGNLLLQGNSLAIATSGLRTNLLFEKPPSENPPFGFPKMFSTFRGDFLRNYTEKPGEKGIKIPWRNFKKI